MSFVEDMTEAMQKADKDAWLIYSPSDDSFLWAFDFETVEALNEELPGILFARIKRPDVGEIPDLISLMKGE